MAWEPERNARQKSTMKQATQIPSLSAARTGRCTTRGGQTRLRMRPWGFSVTDQVIHPDDSHQMCGGYSMEKRVLRWRNGGDRTKIEMPITTYRRSGASLGQRLRGARLGAGMTLRQAAEQIGYSWVAVERCERRCMPPETRSPLASASRVRCRGRLVPHARIITRSITPTASSSRLIRFHASLPKVYIPSRHECAECRDLRHSAPPHTRQ